MDASEPYTAQELVALSMKKFGPQSIIARLLATVRAEKKKNRGQTKIIERLTADVEYFKPVSETSIPRQTRHLENGDGELSVLGIAIREFVDRDPTIEPFLADWLFREKRRRAKERR